MHFQMSQFVLFVYSIYTLASCILMYSAMVGDGHAHLNLFPGCVTMIGGDETWSQHAAIRVS
jgi:hypothetical protein